MNKLFFIISLSLFAVGLTSCNEPSNPSKHYQSGQSPQQQVPNEKNDSN